jgi:hypothetical protein
MLESTTSASARTRRQQASAMSVAASRVLPAKRGFGPAMRMSNRRVALVRATASMDPLL